MALRHRAALLAAVGLLLGGLLITPPRARAAEACFAETGFCIGGRFLDYWQQNGGLARNGYPLTGERRELLEDGDEYTVQYFERVRLEYHPENAPPYDVLLGQFGRRMARTGDRGAVSPLDTPPTAPVPGRVYFPETGHNVAPRFFAYWEANGGLTQFGYPLTEESPKRLGDGQTYTVQYFERARFERHSENDPPYDVLLGQFGRQILAENDALADDRPFQLLYLTDARVQGLLGFVTGTVSVAPGAYLPFERGLMLYEGGAARRIYVFCRSEQFGVTLGPTLADRFFPDPARPGDLSGGGSGPQPGLYEPGSGFGALWRERESIRSCLGYATRPDEIGYTIRRLEFSRGTMLSAVTPAGAFIYVQYASSGPYLYERFPDVGR